MKQAPFSQQRLMAQAQQHHARGDLESAAHAYQQLIRKDPRNPLLYQCLGVAELGLGRTDQAHRHLLQAVHLGPDDAMSWQALSVVHRRAGNFPEALAALDRALARKPIDPSLVAAKSGVLLTMGDRAAAADCLAPALRAMPLNIELALVFARLAPELGRQQEAIDRLRACLADGNTPPVFRPEAMFQIGKQLDSMGEIDAAFAAFDQANALRAGRFDPRAFSLATDQTIRNWTAESAKKVPRGRVDSERPVSIVGMPRSGASLVEQILACHPSVFGAGELEDIPFAARSLLGPAPSGVVLLSNPAVLTRPAVDRIQHDYLERLRRLAPDAARVTDKLPLNFLHLGLIAAAFPQSRVIHCVRDPRDTCLSCYCQSFEGDHPYTYNLRDLAHFYLDYRRLMSHWRSVLELTVLDVVYEDLVQDLENVSRGMVEFLGLPWDAACLNFHESTRVVRTLSNAQVRRPVYASSVGRWRRYERHLGPLLEILDRP